MSQLTDRLLGEPDSRAATNALLAEVRAGRWGPRAWVRFLADATRRSVHQARRHPRALAEVTALHVLFAVLADRRGRAWVAVSWGMAASHLGLLEQRSSIGLASTITLARANLPALAGGRWVSGLALGSDLADGWLARGLGAESRFGAAADSLADAAFWTWFTLRHEPSHRVRAMALLAWLAPVVAVTAASARQGSMVDAPRPVVLRPAAALQAVLTARGIFSSTSTPRYD
ncbi:CDP-alcohol phosphatidyltransferase family protein [Amycolatopsis cihanbeyliensis]|uniref:CDP-alcohol phosphatidyltransferase-like enzyme n=1 Tax=Amycolatopsis cihanbeyliensis TaxID=1128664 RepID=A0A542DF81_AMYCI|nr:CDP-alcohol phosphatidyltransferase family protein [Amycolatopsis cihanbeyliensis]TQJ01737.1 CDP-alcohol phosphatidyltransferase-like enzyme [Amycolatopsis cihanbeyliensis]